MIGLVLIFVGVILVLDQLYLFGIPFGGFLGDLSSLDPTQSPLIRHWMLGVALILIGLILLSRETTIRRKH